jgi:hypothetical protein
MYMHSYLLAPAMCHAFIPACTGHVPCIYTCLPPLHMLGG